MRVGVYQMIEDLDSILLPLPEVAPRFAPLLVSCIPHSLSSTVLHFEQPILATIMGLFTRNLWFGTVCTDVLSDMHGQSQLKWAKNEAYNNVVAAITPFLLERHFEFQPLDMYVCTENWFFLVLLLNWITITYRLVALIQLCYRISCSFADNVKIITSSVAWMQC
jgi:hypothetical protein